MCRQRPQSTVFEMGSYPSLLQGLGICRERGGIESPEEPEVMDDAVGTGTGKWGKVKMESTMAGIQTPETSIRM